MKKIIFSIATILLSCMMLSCEKEPAGLEDVKKTEMKVTIGLGLSSSDNSDATKATVDTGVLRPDTKLVTGDSIALLFFNSNAVDAKVMLTRVVVVPTITETNSIKITETISDIPTTMTHVMALLNYNKDKSEQQVSTEWDILSFLGKTREKILFSLIENADVTEKAKFILSTDLKGKVYYSPSDIFATKTVATNIESETATTTLALTRIVSLCRVVINDKTAGVAKGKLDLSHADNVMMLRQSASAVDVDGKPSTLLVAGANTGVGFAGAFIVNNTVPTGYIGKAMTDMSATKSWKDFVILPHLKATKLNLMLGVHALKGYPLTDGTLVGDAGDVVYFGGEVTVGTSAVPVDIAANRIVVLTVNLTGSAGSITPEAPKELSDFEAVITITGWDETVIDATVDM